MQKRKEKDNFTNVYFAELFCVFLKQNSYGIQVCKIVFFLEFLHAMLKEMEYNTFLIICYTSLRNKFNMIFGEF